LNTGLATSGVSVDHMTMKAGADDGHTLRPTTNVKYGLVAKPTAEDGGT